MEPVYLISSFRRSGSSMMARYLHLGGLPVVYYEGNDSQFNIPFGNSNYIPNPNGFFAIEGFIDCEVPSFYEDMKGKVLKLPRLDLHYVPKGRYKLIFMARDPQEILASYRSFIPYRHWGKVECAVHLYDTLKEATFERLRTERDDYEILEVNYNELIKDPRAAFEAIHAFGVPIDVDKAAAGVDPALYRHRKQGA